MKVRLQKRDVLLALYPLLPKASLRSHRRHVALQAQRVQATLHMNRRILWDLGALRELLQSCVSWDSCRPARLRLLKLL